jgi:hypothetical protein
MCGLMQIVRILLIAIVVNILVLVSHLPLQTFQLKKGFRRTCKLGAPGRGPG